jgi:hypothetical protein
VARLPNGMRPSCMLPNPVRKDFFLSSNALMIEMGVGGCFFSALFFVMTFTGTPDTQGGGLFLASILAIVSIMGWWGTASCLRQLPQEIELRQDAIVARFPGTRFGVKERVLPFSYAHRPRPADRSFRSFYLPARIDVRTKTPIWIRPRGVPSIVFLSPSVLGRVTEAWDAWDKEHEAHVVP